MGNGISTDVVRTEIEHDTRNHYHTDGGMSVQQIPAPRRDRWFFSSQPHRCSIFQDALQYQNVGEAMKQSVEVHQGESSSTIDALVIPLKQKGDVSLATSNNENSGVSPIQMFERQASPLLSHFPIHQVVYDIIVKQQFAPAHHTHSTSPHHLLRPLRNLRDICEGGRDVEGQLFHGFVHWLEAAHSFLSLRQYFGQVHAIQQILVPLKANLSTPTFVSPQQSGKGESPEKRPDKVTSSSDVLANALQNFESHQYASMMESDASFLCRTRSTVALHLEHFQTTILATITNPSYSSSPSSSSAFFLQTQLISLQQLIHLEGPNFTLEDKHTAFFIAAKVWVRSHLLRVEEWGGVDQGTTESSSTSSLPNSISAFLKSETKNTASKTDSQTEGKKEEQRLFANYEVCTDVEQEAFQVMGMLCLHGDYEMFLLWLRLLTSLPLATGGNHLVVQGKQLLVRAIETRLREGPLDHIDPKAGAPSFINTTQLKQVLGNEGVSDGQILEVVIEHQERFIAVLTASDYTFPVPSGETDQQMVIPLPPATTTTGGKSRPTSSSVRFKAPAIVDSPTVAASRQKIYVGQLDEGNNVVRMSLHSPLPLTAKKSTTFRHVNFYKNKLLVLMNDADDQTFFIFSCNSVQSVNSASATSESQKLVWDQLTLQPAPTTAPTAIATIVIKDKEPELVLLFHDPHMTRAAIQRWTYQIDQKKLTPLALPTLLYFSHPSPDIAFIQGNSKHGILLRVPFICTLPFGVHRVSRERPPITSNLEGITMECWAVMDFDPHGASVCNASNKDLDAAVLLECSWEQPAHTNTEGQRSLTLTVKPVGADGWKICASLNWGLSWGHNTQFQCEAILPKHFFQQWTHYAVSVGHDNLDLMMDGEIVGTCSIHSLAFSIGPHEKLTYILGKGLMDIWVSDVRLWGRSLTPELIKRWMSDNPLTFCVSLGSAAEEEDESVLLVWWKLDEGRGLLVLDYSGHERHGWVHVEGGGSYSTKNRIHADRCQLLPAPLPHIVLPANPFQWAQEHPGPSSAQIGLTQFVNTPYVLLMSLMDPPAGTASTGQAPHKVRIGGAVHIFTGAVLPEVMKLNRNVSPSIVDDVTLLSLTTSNRQLHSGPKYRYEVEMDFYPVWIPADPQNKRKVGALQKVESIVMMMAELLSRDSAALNVTPSSRTVALLNDITKNCTAALATATTAAMRKSRSVFVVFLQFAINSWRKICKIVARSGMNPSSFGMRGGITLPDRFSVDPHPFAYFLEREKSTKETAVEKLLRIETAVSKEITRRLSLQSSSAVEEEVYQPDLLLRIWDMAEAIDEALHLQASEKSTTSAVDMISRFQDILQTCHQFVRENIQFLFPSLQLKCNLFSELLQTALDPQKDSTKPLPQQCGPVQRLLASHPGRRGLVFGLLLEYFCTLSGAKVYYSNILQAQLLDSSNPMKRQSLRSLLFEDVSELNIEVGSQFTSKALPQFQVAVALCTITVADYRALSAYLTILRESLDNFSGKGKAWLPSMVQILTLIPLALEELPSEKQRQLWPLFQPLEYYYFLPPLDGRYSPKKTQSLSSTARPSESPHQKELAMMSYDTDGVQVGCETAHPFALKQFDWYYEFPFSASQVVIQISPKTELPSGCTIHVAVARRIHAKWSHPFPSTFAAPLDVKDKDASDGGPSVLEFEKDMVVPTDVSIAIRCKNDDGSTVPSGLYGLSATVTAIRRMSSATSTVPLQLSTKTLAAQNNFSYSWLLVIMNGFLSTEGIINPPGPPQNNNALSWLTNRRVLLECGLAPVETVTSVKRNILSSLIEPIVGAESSSMDLTSSSFELTEPYAFIVDAFKTSTAVFCPLPLPTFRKNAKFVLLTGPVFAALLYLSGELPLFVEAFEQSKKATKSKETSCILSDHCLKIFVVACNTFRLLNERIQQRGKDAAMGLIEECVVKCKFLALDVQVNPLFSSQCSSAHSRPTSAATENMTRHQMRRSSSNVESFAGGTYDTVTAIAKGFSAGQRLSRLGSASLHRLSSLENLSAVDLTSPVFSDGTNSPMTILENSQRASINVDAVKDEIVAQAIEFIGSDSTAEDVSVLKQTLQSRQLCAIRWGEGYKHLMQLAGRLSSLPPGMENDEQAAQNQKEFFVTVLTAFLTHLQHTTDAVLFGCGQVWLTEVKDMRWQILVKLAEIATAFFLQGDPVVAPLFLMLELACWSGIHAEKMLPADPSSGKTTSSNTEIVSPANRMAHAQTSTLLVGMFEQTRPFVDSISKTILRRHQQLTRPVIPFPPQDGGHLNLALASIPVSKSDVQHTQQNQSFHIRFGSTKGGYVITGGTASYGKTGSTFWPEGSAETSDADVLYYEVTVVRMGRKGKSAIENSELQNTTTSVVLGDQVGTGAQQTEEAGEDDDDDLSTCSDSTYYENSEDDGFSAFNSTSSSSSEKKGSKRAFIGLTLSSKEKLKEQKFPRECGNEENYLYVSEGCVYHNMSLQASGQLFGPQFQIGDTIGCGAILSQRVVFFTLNGRYIGVPGSHRLPKKLKEINFLFGLCCKGSLSMNAGLIPFVFPVKDFCSQHYHFLSEHRNLSSDVVSKLASNPLKSFWQSLSFTHLGFQVLQHSCIAALRTQHEDGFVMALDTLTSFLKSLVPMDSSSQACSAFMANPFSEECVEFLHYITQAHRSGDVSLDQSVNQSAESIVSEHSSPTVAAHDRLTNFLAKAMQSLQTSPKCCKAVCALLHSAAQLLQKLYPFCTSSAHVEQIVTKLLAICRQLVALTRDETPQDDIRSICHLLMDIAHKTSLVSSASSSGESSSFSESTRTPTPKTPQHKTPKKDTTNKECLPVEGVNLLYLRHSPVLYEVVECFQVMLEQPAWCKPVIQFMTLLQKSAIQGCNNVETSNLFGNFQTGGDQSATSSLSSILLIVGIFNGLVDVIREGTICRYHSKRYSECFLVRVDSCLNEQAEITELRPYLPTGNEKGKVPTTVPIHGELNAKRPYILDERDLVHEERLLPLGRSLHAILLGESPNASGILDVVQSLIECIRSLLDLNVKGYQEWVVLEAQAGAVLQAQAAEMLSFPEEETPVKPEPSKKKPSSASREKHRYSAKSRRKKKEEPEEPVEFVDDEFEEGEMDSSEDDEVLNEEDELEAPGSTFTMSPAPSISGANPYAEARRRQLNLKQAFLPFAFTLSRCLRALFKVCDCACSILKPEKDPGAEKDGKKPDRALSILLVIQKSDIIKYLQQNMFRAPPTAYSNNENRWAWMSFTIFGEDLTQVMEETVQRQIHRIISDRCFGVVERTPYFNKKSQKNAAGKDEGKPKQKRRATESSLPGSSELPPITHGTVSFVTSSTVKKLSNVTCVVCGACSDEDNSLLQQSALTVVNAKDNSKGICAICFSQLPLYDRTTGQRLHCRHVDASFFSPQGTATNSSPSTTTTTAINCASCAVRLKLPGRYFVAQDGSNSRAICRGCIQRRIYEEYFIPSSVFPCHQPDEQEDDSTEEETIMWLDPTYTSFVTDGFSAAMNNTDEKGRDSISELLSEIRAPKHHSSTHHHHKMKLSTSRAAASTKALHKKIEEAQAGPKESGTSKEAEWECSVCTYLNPMRRVRCEMCDALPPKNKGAKAAKEKGDKKTMKLSHSKEDLQKLKEQQAAEEQATFNQVTFVPRNSAAVVEWKDEEEPLTSLSLYRKHRVSRLRSKPKAKENALSPRGSPAEGRNRPVSAGTPARRREDSEAGSNSVVDSDDDGSNMWEDEKSDSNHSSSSGGTPRRGGGHPRHSHRHASDSNSNPDTSAGEDDNEDDNDDLESLAGFAFDRRQFASPELNPLSEKNYFKRLVTVFWECQSLTLYYFNLTMVSMLSALPTEEYQKNPIVEEDVVGSALSSLTQCCVEINARFGARLGSYPDLVYVRRAIEACLCRHQIQSLFDWFHMELQERIITDSNVVTMFRFAEPNSAFAVRCVEPSSSSCVFEVKTQDPRARKDFTASAVDVTKHLYERSSLAAILQDCSLPATSAENVITMEQPFSTGSNSFWCVYGSDIPQRTPVCYIIRDSTSINDNNAALSVGYLKELLRYPEGRKRLATVETVLHILQGLTFRAHLSRSDLIQILTHLFQSDLFLSQQRPLIHQPMRHQIWVLFRGLCEKLEEKLKSTETVQELFVQRGVELIFVVCCKLKEWGDVESTQQATGNKKDEDAEVNETGEDIVTTTTTTTKSSTEKKPKRKVKKGKGGGSESKKSAASEAAQQPTFTGKLLCHFPVLQATIYQLLAFQDVASRLVNDMTLPTYIVEGETSQVVAGRSGPDMARLVAANDLPSDRMDPSDDRPHVCFGNVVVYSGKWYFEAHCEGHDEEEFGSDRVGWAAEPGKPLPDDEAGTTPLSFIFAYSSQEKINNNEKSPYGRRDDNEEPSHGDIIGCMINFDDGTISFSYNGADLGVAFHFPSSYRMCPVVSTVCAQGIRCYFSDSDFQYRPEGYQQINVLTNIASIEQLQKYYDQPVVADPLWVNALSFGLEQMYEYRRLSQQSDSTDSNSQVIPLLSFEQDLQQRKKATFHVPESQDVNNTSQEKDVTTILQTSRRGFEFWNQLGCFLNAHCAKEDSVIDECSVQWSLSALTPFPRLLAEWQSREKGSSSDKGHDPVKFFQQSLATLKGFSSLFANVINVLDVGNAGGSIFCGTLSGVKSVCLTSSHIAYYVGYNLGYTESDQNHDGIDVELNRYKANNAKLFRDTICAQLYSQLVDKVNSIPGLLQQQQPWFSVEFEGEGSTDYGGPFREAITELGTELCQSRPLDTEFPAFFIPTPNNRHNVGVDRELMVPNPAFTHPHHRTIYTFIGGLMGACFRGKEFLTLPLPKLFWSYMAMEKPSTADLAQVDSVFCTTIRQLETIEAMGIEDDGAFLETIDIYFLTNRCDGEEIELTPGGRNKRVTLSNRLEYIEKAKQFRFHELDIQLEWIRQGMLSVLPPHVLNIMTGSALEHKMAGTPEISVQQLKAITKYSGHLHEEDPNIEMFWKVVESLSNSDRQALVRFVTGRSRLPVESFEIMSSVDDRVSTSLPIAHTCFFQLELPVYESEEIMKEKLLYAAHHCTAIDLDFNPHAFGAGELEDDQ